MMFKGNYKCVEVTYLRNVSRCIQYILLNWIFFIGPSHPKLKAKVENHICDIDPHSSL